MQGIITMEQILSLNFLLYTIAGLWRPVQWSSKYSKLLYSLFTCFAVYLFAYFFLTHLLYITFVVEKLEELVSCIAMIAGLSAVAFKIIIVITRRDQIINLIEMLQGEICKARDEEEIDIQMKFDRSIRSYSMQYLIMAMVSLMSSLTAGTLYMLDSKIPWGAAWVPWDCTSFLIFFFTCIQEFLGGFIGITINVATETTVLGFCLQICARFEVLTHRLQKMMKHIKKEDTVTSSLKNTSNKTNRLSEYVFHHLYIIRLAEMINDVFNEVIFVQFSTSILVLCTLAYRMSSHVTILDINLPAFIGCMFVQIFYYCWGGNEVTLKSAGFGDKIYNMDWILMTNNEQKDLLMIMKRTTRPIKFTSSFLVILSLESYSNLLKVSFSVFNLLQQL